MTNTNRYRLCPIVVKISAKREAKSERAPNRLRLSLSRTVPKES